MSKIIEALLYKIYVYILVNRLNFFGQMFKKNPENQLGFNAECSTIDNAFILKSIIDVKTQKIKIVCCFCQFPKVL
jgi:hypothetical protein